MAALGALGARGLGAALRQVVGEYGAAASGGRSSSGGGGGGSILSLDALLETWDFYVPIPLWAVLAAGVVAWMVLRDGAGRPTTVDGRAASSATWAGHLFVYATALAILYALARWKHVL
jgi:hypothetical protein